MGVIAIIVAQVLDPVRIVALALTVWLSRLVVQPALRWLILLVGVVLVAVVISQVVLGHTGQFATLSTTAGFVSNAVIVAIILGLRRLLRA